MRTATMIAATLAVFFFTPTDAEGAGLNCTPTADTETEHNTMVACDYWWEDLWPVVVTDNASLRWTVNCRQSDNHGAAGIWDTGTIDLATSPTAGRTFLSHGNEMRGIQIYQRDKTFNCTLRVALVVNLSIWLPIPGVRILPPLHVYEPRSVSYTLSIPQCDGNHGGEENPTYFY